ncbi:RagB/SusD family nutrient uptake outer membrane protein [Hymenobacter latericus]|uniref:RagB/SusD family nutrient uptake outer membrane protein n=1 Tax=Hymenobacter sp. YIM 151858-1 TaxID=2987688 RepID=UPI002225EBC3|nr:RagB/SusD family nutrient uptake outer membrane protein [Hymenobacter sp. YIM 151858-1]UYZ59257.1 RagB/SusD family nutrient uptake outer membrane protein [Hymenobacter sp. YIM 151858-1]
MRRAAAAGLLLTLGLGTGCQDQLDLQPQQSVDAEQALSTPEGVDAAVVGGYARLGRPQLYGTNYLLVPELLASNNYINWLGTFQSYRELAQKTNLTSFNVEADRTFDHSYRTINHTNLIIDALPVVTNQANRQRYEGEARMMRAMVYFELVRLYGLPYRAGQTNSQPGVPINLTPNKTEEQAARRLPRATVEEVYQQVVTDLQAAIQLLPTNNGNRLDRFDAQAFLSRVRLQQGRYAEALALANDVINNSGASLNPSVLSAFTNRNTRESLFEIQQNDQNNAGAVNDGLATFYTSRASGFNGRGDVQIVAAFASQYGPGDQRGSGPILGSLIYTGDGPRAGRLRNFKYNDPGQNIPLIRLAEMYLTRAECNVRLGSSVGDTPLNDVNRIRRRAGAAALTAVTLDDVLKERELELAFEGFRLHDYKRTQRNITSVYTFDSPRLVLPIPQREINLGSSLPQNPGY